MKCLVIGDMHGKSLKTLDVVVQEENPDMFVCLGDFDQVSVIQDFLELEQRMKNDGRQVIAVPGNHDYAVLNNQSISSGTLWAQDKTIGQLYQELIADPIAFGYLRGLVKGDHTASFHFDKRHYGKRYNMVAIHGGFAGDLSSYYYCPDEIADLWFRLRSGFDHKANFDMMKQNGYRVMLRGHDHKPSLAMAKKKQGGTILKPSKEGVKLDKRGLYTITVGAFFDGHYAMIESRRKGPIVKHLNVWT